MKQLILLLAVALPCLFITACDFTPSGEHYEEISPEPVVNADLSLFPDKDTIYVRGSTTLNFIISIPGRPLQRYDLRLDNKTIASGTQYNGTVYFNSENYSNGYHVLQLGVVTNSGTGSLADKVGVELLEVYRTWTVYIENGPPQSSAIVSIKPENGALRIDWQKYPGHFFESYSLVRQMPGEYNKVIGTITDKNQTSLLDTTYVGGTATYFVMTKAQQQSWYGSSSSGPNRIYFFLMPRIIKHSYDAQNNLTVSFSSTPFYRAFDSYELVKPNGQSVIIPSRTDTVAILGEQSFGSDLTVKLITYPKNTANKLSYAYTNAMAFTVPSYGEPWGPLTHVQTRAAVSKFYSFATDKATIVDAHTLQVLAQSTFVKLKPYNSYSNVALSEDARYLYYAENGKIHKVNPTSLQNIESYELPALLQLPGHQYTHLDLSVSNTNRLLINAHSDYTYRDTVYVVDMMAKKVLSRNRTLYYLNPAEISPRGNQYNIYPDIYQQQANGTWEPIERIPDEQIRSFAYHPAKPWYLTRKGTTISFYDEQSHTLQATLTTEAPLEDIRLDASADLLYGYANNTLYVYNLSTGQLRRKLPLAGQAAPFVFGNRIFSHNRFIPL
ncbi:YncE family protein [Pontibacter oryzae]|uniref:Uncharacterized protein n=1 Tax=Pontibacter oryzae TaxID=2304593 RepID=A0A399RVI4_9BACT|nr:hypothetical protein [Pontibacter oryzae]RIJ34334.1 hypothetical protein D1627_15545 [Pontibacter oryzae]